MVRLDGIIEEVKSLNKQIQIDIHVARTKAEQKADALAKEHKDFAAWSQTTFR